MKRLFLILCAAALLFAGCSGNSGAGSLGPEEFLAYPSQGDPISPAETQGEITITKSGVILGNMGSDTDAYEGLSFSSKRGITPGSTLDELAEAYPGLRFNVIYGQSKDFKVETGVTLKKIVKQAKSGTDIMFVMYSVRSIDGKVLSDKEFNDYCKKNGIDNYALASDPEKYGYESRSLIFGINGQEVDSLSFTATIASKASGSLSSVDSQAKQPDAKAESEKFASEKSAS